MKEFIGYYTSAIPETLSKNIMKIKDGWKPSGFSGHEKRKDDKYNKERVVMDEIYIEQYTPFYNDLFKAVINVVNAYKQLHPYTKYMSAVRCTNFRVNKYTENGFMSEHADAIYHSHGQNYGFPETSVLFFLNSDYEGGEFVVANNIYKPKKNSAIIFPANFMFPHYVKQIKKGTRYSIITWLM